MKVVLLSLLVCALASTGLSYPVENEKKSFITLGNLVDLNSNNEYYLRELKRVRDELATVVDNLRMFGSGLKANYIHHSVVTAESLIEQLKNHKLDTRNLTHFLKESDEKIENYSSLYSRYKKEPLIDHNHDHYLSELKRERDELTTLRDKLTDNGDKSRARSVQFYVADVEILIEKLENRKLDTGPLDFFLYKMRSVKERYSVFDNSIEDLDMDDLLEEIIDQDDLPSEEEKKENWAKLQIFRKKLVDLRDKLIATREYWGTRIVRKYIKASDEVIYRVRADRFENTRVANFLERIQTVLDRFA